MHERDGDAVKGKQFIYFFSEVAGQFPDTSGSNVGSLKERILPPRVLNVCPPELWAAVVSRCTT